MNSPFLIGTKVYLRPFEKSDAATLAPWFNDPEVTQTLLIHRPVNVAHEEEFIQKAYTSDTDLNLGIVAVATEKLIGTTALHRIESRHRHASFGLAIGEKGEWGKGYGTEAARLLLDHAFLTLNLNRVWLHVFEYNHRGLAVYERVGFRREGILRQDCFRAGKYWDTIVMGILREEWESIRRQGTF